MSLLFRRLLRELARERAQVAALSLVVAAAVALQLAMHGTLRSLERSRDLFYAESRFSDVFAAARRVPGTVLARLATLPGVRAVEGRIDALAPALVPGAREPATLHLAGLPDSGLPALDRPVLLEGRPPRPHAGDEILLARAFAEANRLRPGDRLRVHLAGRPRVLRVVGIATSAEFAYVVPPGALAPDDRRFGAAWVRRGLLEGPFGLREAANTVRIALAAGAREAAVVAAVDRILAPWGGRGAHGREHQLSHAVIDNELRQLAVFGTALPLVFLLVAAFLIDAALVRRTEAERQVLGVLRALGFDAAPLARTVLARAVLTVLPGIALGLAAGLLLADAFLDLYAAYFRFPCFVSAGDPAAALLAVLAALLAAALGALRALVRILRLEPAEAMRPFQPPAAYGRGPERLVAGLDALTLQALRHLLRRPLRALFAAAGIAAGCALLLSASAWLSAVEVMLRESFERGRHDDLAVAFTAPLARGAVDALARRPGVLRAEGRLALPVRLCGDRACRDAVLVGLPADARLERAGREGIRPADGLALSRALARRIGARAGDVVSVEPREGRRGARAVRVRALVGAWIGTPAWAPLSLVRELRGAGPAVDSVLLRVDPLFEPDLARELAGLRAVASITRRRALADSFRELMAESVVIVFAVYGLFAGLLVAGVVTATARLLLAERGREIATMVVLGFTRTEAASTLLAELALLLLLAMPLSVPLALALMHGVALSLESELFRIPVVVRGRDVLVAWGFLLLVALLLAPGLFARIRAMDVLAATRARE